MNTGNNATEYLKDNLWTTTEAAAYLGFEPNTLAVWRSNKRYDLRPIKIGRTVRYCPAFVREFAAKTFMIPQ